MATQIQAERFTLGNNVISIRHSAKGTEFELTDKDGQTFALDNGELKEMVRVLTAGPKSQGRTVARAARAKSNFGRRYTEDEKKSLLKDFAEAPNKTKFASDKGVSYITLLKWLKAGEGAKPKSRRRTDSQPAVS